MNADKNSYQIPLNASNYLSEWRKQAFQKALEDGHRITGPDGRPSGGAPPPEKGEEGTAPAVPESSTRAPAEPTPGENGRAAPPLSASAGSPDGPDNSVRDELKTGIQHSFAHQNRTIEVHQQYLEGQEESIDLFHQVLQQGEKLLQNRENGEGGRLLENLHRSLDHYQDLQEKGLQVHQQFLAQQADYSRAFLKLLERQQDPDPARREGTEFSPEVKPGVEPPSHPPEPAPKPNPPSASAPRSKGPAAPGSEPPPASEEEDQPASTAPVPERGPSLDELTSSLLDVVGEKTGYPAEMLELDMDVEADLGIDSIKRVEILGALEEAYPQLPPADTDALAELRTLDQITSYLERGIGGAPPQDEPSTSTGSAAGSPDQPSPSSTESVSEGLEKAPEVQKPGPGQDLTAMLMDVVAEKTGYPADMLELDMDMEADLGIDSIKRVEILGAMEEQVPDLPPFDTETLAEMRTLEEVAAAMSNFASPPGIEQDRAARKKKADLPDVRVGARESREAVQGVRADQVGLGSLPPPDYLDYQLPDHRPLLVSDEGSAFTRGLISSLKSTGWKVVLGRFSEQLVPHQNRIPEDEFPQFTFDGNDPDQIPALLSTIRDQFGSPAGFIHLHPRPQTPDFFSDHERELVRQVFFWAKGLDPFFQGKNGPERQLFLTVSQIDGGFGLRHPEALRESSALPGLVKTLAWEWPHVFCRAVDLDPGLPVEKKPQRCSRKSGIPTAACGKWA